MAENPAGTSRGNRAHLLRNAIVLVSAASVATVGVALARIPVDGVTLTIVSLEVIDRPGDPFHGRLHIAIDKKTLRGASTRRLLFVGGEYVGGSGGGNYSSDHTLLLKARGLLGDYSGGGSENWYETSSPETVELLVQQGASYYLKDGEKLTLARFQVERFGKTEIAEVVIEVGPPITDSDEFFSEANRVPGLQGNSQ